MSEADIIKEISNGRATIESRWARFGPYYAMFPMDFACNVVSHYSKPNELVLDPFAGRGSSVFAAAALQRYAYGVEINPVGWLYSNVKLYPASEVCVANRLDEIIKLSQNELYFQVAVQSSEFFKVCFSKNVLAFLIAAKDNLNWQNCNIDATLMSFIILYLHGKRGYSLSNQMPMTKSTSINYSLEWWKAKGLDTPPDVDILSFFKNRLKWRYGKGTPRFDNGTVVLGDSTVVLPQYATTLKPTQSVKLLFTSPPYYGVTNYFVDQWLRMWMLGGAEEPTILTQEKYKKRFDSKPDYEELLDTIFGQCKEIMAPQSTVYIRTDIRDYTLNTTRAVLKKHFPDYSYHEEYNFCKKKSQTELLNNSTIKPCEVDIILKR